MYRSTRIHLAFALVLVVCGLRVRGADAPRIKFRPIPVDVEGHETAPGFYVGVEERTFNLSVDALAKDSAADSPERALADYMHAILTNDRVLYRAVTDAGNDAAALLKGDRHEFGKHANPRVVQRFAVGGATLFALDLGPKSDADLGLLLFQKRGGRHICTLEGEDHAIVQVLIGVARGADHSPTVFAATDAPKDCPNAVTFKHLFGDDGGHPVTIRFNGYRLDYPMGGRARPAPGLRDLKGLPADYADAVRCYAGAVDDLAAGNVDGFMARLGGAPSKDYFRQQVNLSREHAIDHYASRERHIRYVLGSPGLKVMLEQRDHPTEGFPWSFEEIATPPVVPKAAIVNYHQDGTLEGLLGWDEFIRAVVDQYVDPPTKK